MLKMSGNMIDRVTEEALKGYSNLSLLDLSHNLLHDQSIPANTWTHLKYVHPPVQKNAVRFLATRGRT